MTAVVPAHRCGAVPDSHRVPCWTAALAGQRRLLTHTATAARGTNNATDPRCSGTLRVNTPDVVACREAPSHGRRSRRQLPAATALVLRVCEHPVLLQRHWMLPNPDPTDDRASTRARMGGRLGRKVCGGGSELMRQPRTKMALSASPQRRAGSGRGRAIGGTRKSGPSSVTPRQQEAVGAWQPRPGCPQRARCGLRPAPLRVPESEDPAQPVGGLADGSRPESPLFPA
jgi:hypothetical protein